MTLCLLGGLDPTGGAGIARDLATALAIDPRLDLRALDGSAGGDVGEGSTWTEGRHRAGLRAALTATTQQGRGVLPRTLAVHPAAVTRALLVDAPLRSDVAAAAPPPTTESREVVKIGLVPDALAGSLRVALQTLRGRESAGTSGPVRVVVDPVLGATAGGNLGVSAEGLLTWLPLADLVTPNANEASRLLAAVTASGGVATTREAMSAGSGHAMDPVELAVELARGLARRADREEIHVLLKGGHAATGSVVRDVLASADGVIDVLERPRLVGPEIRGTGCALATALATLWHRDGSLLAATRAAVAWLDETRRHAVAEPKGDPPSRCTGARVDPERATLLARLPTAPDTWAHVAAALRVLVADANEGSSVGCA